MRRAYVHRLPMSAPDDMRAIISAIEEGVIQPSSVLSVLGKTEGNGCVNDFTRGFAVQTLKGLFNRYLDDDAVSRISMVMSGGTEGGLSPHWLVFERREVEAPSAQGPALALGRASTRTLRPEEIGRMAQLEAVAEAVGAAMAEAGIQSPDQVHYVQIKCPLLTAERVGEALARSETTATRDMLHSMGLSRGASALGVALALGEVNSARLNDGAIGKEYDLFSGRASASAGTELMVNEVVVMGMSDAWTGPLRIDHVVLADAIDAAALRRILDPERVRPVAVLAKAEASRDGLIRGNRHTMLDDSDISSTRHARAFVGGMLAGAIGHTQLFVSGGAEHQGPDGGGPCAIISTINP